MTGKRDRDEHLEHLWYMKESKEDSLDELKKIMGENFYEDVFKELLEEDFVKLIGEDNKVFLTEKGGNYARQIIRAHRIAERLLADVLEGEYEKGACEFEHTINPDLVNSICTLLGHPRECPHGRLIPEGECCKRSDKTAETTVIPLTELEVGQMARIAYVQCKNDQQLHRIDGLQIRPGVEVKLHQKYPTFVIECEGASIALDQEVASNIRVWSKGDKDRTVEQTGSGFLGGFIFRQRGRKGRKH